MMDEFKLNPCYKCGGKAIFKVLDRVSGKNGFFQISFTIVCSKCGLRYPVVYYSMVRIKENGEIRICGEDDREYASQEWNKRMEENKRERWIRKLRQIFLKLKKLLKDLTMKS